jgi:Flp pilus assembly protein TadG
MLTGTRCEQPDAEAKVMGYRQRSASRVPGRRGQALVEFCLSLPLLLVCFCFVVDVARYLHVRVALEAVARDGAQYAVLKDPSTSQFPTDTQVDSRVAAAMPTWMGSYSLIRNLNASVGGDAAVSIRISTTMQAFIPVPGVLPDPCTIVAEAWMPKR